MNYLLKGILYCFGIIFFAWLLWLFSGCANEIYTAEMWRAVQMDYPICEHKPIPKIVWDRNVGTGMYCTSNNTIILNPDTFTMAMLKEEMVHACGEPIGKDHIMKGGIE